MACRKYRDLSAADGDRAGSAQGSRTSCLQPLARAERFLWSYKSPREASERQQGARNLSERWNDWRRAFLLYYRVQRPPTLHPMKSRPQSLPRHWGRFIFEQGDFG